MSHSRATFLVCLLLSFAVGATINSLASSLLAFQKVFGASNEVLGRIQLLFFIGGGMIVVAGGWITERLGEKKAAFVALACLSLGSLTVGWAPSLPWIFVSAILFGLGCTWASVAYSVIVSRQYADKRQSMFSIISLSETASAILQPVAFSSWFAHVQSSSGDSWLSAFLGLAAVPLTALAVLSLIWKPAPITVGEIHWEQEKGQIPARHVIFSRAMWLVGLCVLLHGLFQIGFVSWIGPYHASRTGISPAEAALFISVNSAGFFPGRALLGWLCAKIKIPDLVLLGIASGSGTLMIVLALLARHYSMALVLSFFQGFLVSGDAPAMSSFVGGRFVQRAALAYALYGGFGQVGAAAGGYVIGVLGDFLGNIQQAAWLIPAVGGSLSLLTFSWHLVGKRSPRDKSAETRARMTNIE